MNKKSLNQELLDQQDGMNRLADAFIVSARRWERVIYPVVLVFILAAGYGFTLLYSLTKNLPAITGNMDIIGQAFDTNKESAAMILMAKDIKSISSNLSIMTKRIDKLEINIANMTGSVGSMKDDVNEMSGTIISMDYSLKVVSSDLGGLTYSVNHIGYNIGELNSNISPPLNLMNRFVP